MERFRDLSIDKKISRTILITTITSLLIASAAIIGYEAVVLRRSALEELNSLAEIVGANSAGAVAFSDTTAAENILSKLADDKSIIAARIFGPSGVPLATYVRPNERALGLRERPELDQAKIYEGRLRVFKTVRYREDPIGNLYIESDMGRAYKRFWHFGRILLLVVILLISFVLVLIWVISRRLQRMISDPIKELADVANEIASGKKYSIRARSDSHDEVGRLVDTFNHMLDTIEERDRQLVRQAEELWRSNRELEQFAYVSSHDLQEPLRTVTIYSQFLERNYGQRLDEDGKKFIETIVSAGSRMRTLISDLLTYSRVTRPELKLEQINLSSVVDEVLINLESSISDAKAEVKVDPLPSVRANVSQMQQLFQNLIGNALKFRGNRPPVIHVTCEDKENEWLIGIHDNGIGIEREYFEKIFRVFQRLHTESQYSGTGIGLAICKKIVEQMGGRIWVESTPGDGATFYFTISKTIPELVAPVIEVPPADR